MNGSVPQYLQELFSPTQSTLFSPLLFSQCRLTILRFSENANKKRSMQGHSTVLHQPSGTGCQTHSDVVSFQQPLSFFFLFFLKLFIHPPVSSSPSPELFSNSAFCIPLLTVPSQPLSFPIITKHNKHVAAYMESNCAMQADIDTDMDITVK